MFEDGFIEVCNQGPSSLNLKDLPAEVRGHSGPGNRVYDSHRAQIGAYFLLIEEATVVRPPHEIIMLGDGRRGMVENTADLRECGSEDRRPD